MSRTRKLPGRLLLSQPWARSPCWPRRHTPPMLEPAPPSGEPTIIDGRVARDASWAARLFVDGQETCTASVIAPERFLTAQHRVADVDVDRELSLNIGDVDRNRGATATVRRGGVHTHRTADLALVNLESPVRTEYAPLGGSADVRSGQTVRTYGWGATCTGLPEAQCQSQNPKVADVRAVNTECSDCRGGTARATRGAGTPAGGTREARCSRMMPG